MLCFVFFTHRIYLHRLVTKQLIWTFTWQTTSAMANQIISKLMEWQSKSIDKTGSIHIAARSRIAYQSQWSFQPNLLILFELEKNTLTGKQDDQHGIHVTTVFLSQVLIHRRTLAGKTVWVGHRMLGAEIELEPAKSQLSEQTNIPQKKHMNTEKSV